MLDRLTAYGGWNTSSNTLGTVIAHVTACYTARGNQAEQWSKKFLFLRYLEDWGYMANVRRRVTERLGEIDKNINALDLGDKEPEVKRLVEEKLKEFQKRYFPDTDWEFDIHMPWNRMFEIEIELS